MIDPLKNSRLNIVLFICSLLILFGSGNLQAQKLYMESVPMDTGPVWSKLYASTLETSSLSMTASLRSTRSVNVDSLVQVFASGIDEGDISKLNVVFAKLDAKSEKTYTTFFKYTRKRYTEYKISHVKTESSYTKVQVQIDTNYLDVKGREGTLRHQHLWLLDEIDGLLKIIHYTVTDS